MEEAAAEECVGQFLFVIARDDDDGPVSCRYQLLRFVNIELHAIEFPQQVVGKLDIGLVDLVDQQYRLLLRCECFPDLALLDVVGNVVNAIVPELRVPEPRHGIVLVEPLLRLGRRFDMPFEQRLAERVCDFDCELGLARTGLAFDEDRPLERDRCVDGRHQVVGGDVGRGTCKAGVCHVGPGMVERMVSILPRGRHLVRGPGETTWYLCQSAGNRRSVCCASPGRKGLGCPCTHSSCPLR